MPVVGASTHQTFTDLSAGKYDALGVLVAVAPQVGGPRVIAAAPEIMVALGLDLDAEG
jgi:hypothetical protein